MFKSKCCKADVTWVMSPDFPGDDPKKMKIGTCWFQCEECGKNCDTDIDPSLVKNTETPIREAQPEEEFKWILTIEAVQNGYHLKGTDLDIVIEKNEEDPLKGDEVLLLEVMEYFNFGGSKHDAQRIRIIREKQKKCKTTVS